MFVLKNHTLE